MGSTQDPDGLDRRSFLTLAGTAAGAATAAVAIGGWSTSPGLVVDVTPMSRVSVDPAAGTARAGAGTLLIGLYAERAGHGLAVPAGSCPTVGMAGLALGGGVGVVGRLYGLTCDNVLGVQIVTADGVVRECGPGAEPGLYWAGARRPADDLGRRRVRRPPGAGRSAARRAIFCGRFDTLDRVPAASELPGRDAGRGGLRLAVGAAMPSAIPGSRRSAQPRALVRPV